MSSAIEVMMAALCHDLDAILSTTNTVRAAALETSNGRKATAESTSLKL